VAEHFAAQAAEQRSAPTEIPHFGHQANTSGAFKRRAPTQTVELMRDPTEEALAARRRLHAEQAAMHQYSGRFATGRSVDELVPVLKASAAPYDLASNRTVVTQRTNLSGRTAED
jgi:hypothetical protein